MGCKTSRANSKPGQQQAGPTASLAYSKPGQQAANQTVLDVMRQAADPEKRF